MHTNTFKPSELPVIMTIAGSWGSGPGNRESVGISNAGSNSNLLFVESLY